MTDLSPQTHPVVETAELRLYKEREPIFPKAVTGSFRRLKWILLTLMLAVYYLTPWIRWDRGPGMPDQAVLVDLANRRFFFFFIEIWPQEFYYVAGLLIMAGLGLFLFTSVLGRVWCGYACPQTIWTDLFLLIERRIDGDRNAQIRLHKAPWTGEKIARRLTKWSLWLLVAAATGGAWVFYFSDAPTLARQIFNGTAPSVVYVTIGVLTTTTFVFAGFMREQICIYACPWPRIQGAMLDENSLVVTYKDWRGEPRGKLAKKADPAAAPARGDCIDCNQCVAVCPMGIDIRQGQQLECITCALCIDACDGVMQKIGKPPKLIGYATLKDVQLSQQAKAAGLPDHNHPSIMSRIVRPRTILYAALWSGIGLAMLGVLLTRSRTELSVLHDRNPMYVTLSDGSIRNGYTIKILNMKGETRAFTLKAEGEGFPVSMRIVGEDLPAGAAETTLSVEPDKLRAVKVFLTAPRDALKSDAQEVKFHIVSGDESAEYESTFAAPKPLRVRK